MIFQGVISSNADGIFKICLAILSKFHLNELQRIDYYISVGTFSLKIVKNGGNMAAATKRCKNAIFNI